MKKTQTDRFKHLPEMQQFVCLKALQHIEQTALQSGVLGMAVSVLLTDGHTVTLSKFNAAPEEVSIMTSWQQ
ncbi:MAG: hypothetical protein ACRDCA_07060 [Serratia sp. (in: enterobacteria)]|uniref:hypothetical protein n=1 Tax=Serratia sp. (in: enterobacteria) TaxID=616 RepID=UPI003F3139B7